jgi:hypothetical protein
MPTSTPSHPSPWSAPRVGGAGGWGRPVLGSGRDEAVPGLCALSGRVARWLGGRRAPLVVVCLGLALASPALTGGFTADDHLHRLMARGDPGIPGLQPRPLDLFVFASGDPGDAARLRDAGVYPWWTDLGVRIAFLRPLSSATHAVDHALWPERAGLMLLHNFVWLALSLVLAWRFYRRFVQVRWLAVLALLLYAADDARGATVGWIADRNALIAPVFAIPALLAHDRWRRTGWRPGSWLGPLAFVLALAAGEGSLAITGYLGAHALWLDRGRWRSRILALVPYAGAVLIWRWVYGALGYGVIGSGIYHDPGAEPLLFGIAAAVRIPLLLLGQLGLPWSDASTLYPLMGPRVMPVMVVFAVAFLTAVGLACVRLLRHDATARFFATGMVLAALPVASTLPADRLLGFVGLGGMGLVAQLLGVALTRRDLLPGGGLRRTGAMAVAAVMAVVHLALAPPLLLARSRSMVTVGAVFDRADRGIPSDPAVTGRTVILVTAPSDAFGGYLTLMRASRRQARPAHLYWLATAITPVTVERVAERTLRVTPEGGFLRYQVDQMLRTPARPFARGERILLAGVTIEIEAVAEGRPLSVLARFDRALDDRSLVWRRWSGRTYVDYVPPPLGASEVLPPLDMLKMLE